MRGRGSEVRAGAPGVTYQKGSSVVLVGAGRQRQVFNLPHEVYCESTGRCLCSSRKAVLIDHDPATGHKRPRVKDLRACSSFSIGWHERLRFDCSVLECPGVQAAISGRRLRVVRDR